MYFVLVKVKSAECTVLLHSVGFSMQDVLYCKATGTFTSVKNLYSTIAGVVWQVFMDRRGCVKCQRHRKLLHAVTKL